MDACFPNLVNFGLLSREQKTAADIADIFVVSRPHLAALRILVRRRSLWDFDKLLSNVPGSKMFQ